MVVGYVRVSTVEQNEARQMEALEQKGVEKIFIEKVSGKNMDRLQLKAMMEFVREGDVVCVSDFSRLSRSLEDLLRIMKRLEDKKVQLVSLKENFDTNSPTGRLMLEMIAAFNEFERTNMLERQREGIECAKRNGAYKGRKPLSPENFDEVYRAWKDKKITAVAASKLLSVSRGSFYNLMKRHEEQSISE